MAYYGYEYFRVIIICDEIEIDKLKNCVDTVVGEKGNKKYGYAQV